MKPMSPQPPLPQVRRIPFEFPDDLSPVWHPTEPEWAAMLNGASLTMPYLEPFLMRTMREAMEPITEPALKAAANAFIGQEGQHFRAHRRFNDLLKARRYPGLARIEETMAHAYERLMKRSLRTRLAYTAGFESMTMGLTRWLVEDRVRLFAGADARVVSFVLWHMVEETEHKCAAYDLYQARFGGSLTGYLARMVGVFHGSLDVMRFSMQGYREMLKTDGRWWRLRSRVRLTLWLTRFALNVGPALLRAVLPGHDPRHERDPEWVRDWLRLYRVDDSRVPMVDTQDPAMPVPFPARLGAPH